MLHKWLFLRHLEEGEQVLMIVHKHWMLGVKHLFWPVTCFIGLSFLPLLAPVPPVFVIVSILLLTIALWCLREFFDYYLDAWLITDMGIIDIEWHGWFHRQSTRILYSDIQGVSHEIHGILNTMLRYGTIAVEKISTGTLIGMENVANPRVVESTILQNMETYLHQKNLKDATVVQDLLANVIAREMQSQELKHVQK